MAKAATLTAEVLPQIERYAVAIARWREAEQQLATQGVIILAPSSGVAAVNPWHNVGRSAAAEASRLERELGLSPLRWSRVDPAAYPLLENGKPAPKTEFNRLFGDTGDC
jgi:phage terminase small subunit